VTHQNNPSEDAARWPSITGRRRMQMGCIPMRDMIDIHWSQLGMRRGETTFIDDNRRWGSSSKWSAYSFGIVWVRI
jgi:hypothetical protein